MKGLTTTILPRLLLALVLASLPLALVIFTLIWQSNSQIVQQQRQQAQLLAERLASNESKFISRVQRALARISESPGLRDLESQACSRYLGQLLLINEEYANLSVANPDGEIICSARPLSGRVNVMDREFFRQVLAQERFVIGSTDVNRVTKMNSVSLAQPIMDSRRARLRGVVIATLSLDFWSRRLASGPLPPGGRIFLVDNHDMILAHYPPNERVIGLFADTYGYETRQAMLKGNAISIETQDRTGSSQFHIYQPLSLTADHSMVLGLSTPTESAFAVGKKLLWKGTLLLLLPFLILLGVIYYALKTSVADPLRQLLAYTKSLGRDEMDELPAIGNSSEVDELRLQIVDMVRTHLTAEADLSTSESRFRQIAETVQEVFWVVTPDWKQVLYVNPAYESVWQLSAESLYRQPTSWLSSVVREDRQRLVAYINGLEESDYTEIVFPLYRIERRDGTLRWISAKGFPAYSKEGELVSVIGIAEDVTELKQYEIELREREAKYRLLVEHAEDLVVKVDTEGRFLFVSPSYCRTFGKTEHQLLGKAFMPLVHEEDQEATTEAMKDLYYPPFTAYMEQRAMTVEGWRWLGWSDKAILDEHQHVTEIIGVGRDITRQKQVEFALRKSETLYRELVDNMSDGVAVYQRIGETDDFIVTNFNHAAERMLGYARDQVIGHQLDQILPGVKEMGLLKSIREVAKDGKPRQCPSCYYRDERIELWLEYYVFKLPSEEIVAVLRNATKEQAALEALR